MNTSTSCHAPPVFKPSTIFNTSSRFSLISFLCKKYLIVFSSLGKNCNLQTNVTIRKYWKDLKPFSQSKYCVVKFDSVTSHTDYHTCYLGVSQLLKNSSILLKFCVLMKNLLTEHIKKFTSKPFKPVRTYFWTNKNFNRTRFFKGRQYYNI